MTLRTFIAVVASDEIRRAAAKLASLLQSAADDVKWVTAAMQKQFESWIREAPEQWSWNNRRWG